MFLYWPINSKMIQQKTHFSHAWDNGLISLIEDYNRHVEPQSKSSKYGRNMNITKLFALFHLITTQKRQQSIMVIFLMQRTQKSRIREACAAGKIQHCEWMQNVARGCCDYHHDYRNEWDHKYPELRHASFIE